RHLEFWFDGLVGDLRLITCWALSIGRRDDSRCLLRNLGFFTPNGCSSFFGSSIVPAHRFLLSGFLRLYRRNDRSSRLLFGQRPACRRRLTGDCFQIAQNLVELILGRQFRLWRGRRIFSLDCCNGIFKKTHLPLHDLGCRRRSTSLRLGFDRCASLLINPVARLRSILPECRYSFSQNRSEICHANSSVSAQSLPDGFIHKIVVTLKR